jgi:predicted Rossmann fold flavoprotein
MKRAVFVGGGAAGFFAALAFADEQTGARAIVLEKGPQFLQKVRISGGGRCNVTHRDFDAREFARRYPRGEKELIGLLHRFPARETVAWFEERGVKLKTEEDGRMFPVTDSSQTVIDCLLSEARRLAVELRVNAGVESIERSTTGFNLRLNNGDTLAADVILLATGGSRTASMAALATSLGHTLVEPVPSLFTLQIESAWLRNLAGISVPDVRLAVADSKLSERGALLITHWGLSGPATLRLSAWGARLLHGLDYRFCLFLNWLPAFGEEELHAKLTEKIKTQPAKFVVNSPLQPLPSRLWEALVVEAGIGPEATWSQIGRSGKHALVQQLTRTKLAVTGKSLNKDEFVTCGGVKLSEVNFKTMESRVCPGLYFAGECLDIDGITGGFNFQAAWATGWVAAEAMAGKIKIEQEKTEATE